MKRIVWLLAFSPILETGLCADWKIVTRTDNSSVTEFFKGALIRTDSLPAYTTVLDFDRRRQVNWRTDLRQYAIVEWSPGSRVYQSDSSLAPSITIECDTTDTGERKQFFGRTARRLLTRVTRSDAPETMIDAWYIDAPGLPKWKNGAGGSFAVLTISGHAPPRIEVKQTGAVPTGLPVWQKTTSSAILGRRSQFNLESISEVTDLVEGTLPDKLFLPPDGYQRVASLPNVTPRPVLPSWAELIRTHWQLIEDWFSTWF